MKRTKQRRREIRHYRVRKKVMGTSRRPRLSLYKSGKHLYVTVSDDLSNPQGSVALLNLTTNTKENKKDGKKAFRNAFQAKALGDKAGKALVEKGIKQVVFDRGGYKYHGNVKALADAVREAGVKI